MNERSNDRGNFVRLVWDFLFGAIIIGAAPLITLVLVIFVGTAIFHVNMGALETMIQKAACAIFLATVFAAPVAVLWFVIRWRKGHRLLPVSTFWLEISLGLLAGAVLFIYLIAMWGFASIN